MPYIYLNVDKRMPEWQFYKESDSISKELLFDLALKGTIRVKIKNVDVDCIYYVEKYNLHCGEAGGQGGEMIFYDNDNWLLFGKNYSIWM